MLNHVFPQIPPDAFVPPSGTYGSVPPGPPHANVPFPRVPRNSPYLPPPGGAPEPEPPRRREEDAFSRGDVVECESCGYVFVLAGKQCACRRCKREDLVKWRGS